MPRKNKKLPRHLLVIRTSAMGDVAMLPHALRALKEAYPEVKVTVATKSLFHPFFEGVDVDFLDIEKHDKDKLFTQIHFTRYFSCSQ